MPKPIIVILFALALASRAEDWPQWRGSGRDGVWHETGIRKSFPAEGLPVRCRALVVPTYPFGGKKLTWAAPSFANRHIFARNETEIICASLSQ